VAVEAIGLAERSPAAAADDPRVGIVGAGKLGTTLARAAIAAGYDVAVSGSGPADQIALTVDVLAPGARAVTTDELVRLADIVVLAVPAHRFRELPRDLFAGKILVDAMNYWQPVDGDDAELADAPDGTSTLVQEHFPSARLVKSLNQLGYHELDQLGRPSGAPDRVAVGAAGYDREAVRTVMRLVDPRIRPRRYWSARERSGAGARRLAVRRHVRCRRAARPHLAGTPRCLIQLEARAESARKPGDGRPALWPKRAARAGSSRAELSARRPGSGVGAVSMGLERHACVIVPSARGREERQ
jgi:predicted dinucleotide-binding enzyme